MAGPPRRKPPSAARVAPSSLLLAAMTAKKSTTKRAAREPVAVDAPPLSSSDEAEMAEGEGEGGGEGVSSSKKGTVRDGKRARSTTKNDDEDDGDDGSDSSSSGGYGQRGDLQPTAFKRPAAADRTGSMSLRQRPPAKRPLHGAQKQGNENDEDDKDDEDDKLGHNSGSNSNGTSWRRQTHTVVPFDQSRKPAPRMYSSRKPFLLSSKRGNDSTSHKGWDLCSLWTWHLGTQRMLTSAPGPERLDSSDRDEDIPDDNPVKGGSAFIKPPVLSPEHKSPRKTFRHRKPAPEDEESPAKKAASFQWPLGAREYNDGDETVRARARRNPAVPAAGADADARQKSSSSSSSSSSKQRQAVTKGTPALDLIERRRIQRLRRLQQRRNGTSARFGALELEPASGDDDDEQGVSQRAVFKMPAGFGDPDDSQLGNDDIGGGVDDDDDDVDDDRNTSSGVNARWGSPSASANESDNSTAPERAVVCPLCDTPLDDDVLHALFSGGRPDTRKGYRARLQLMKFDEKMGFCARHRQQTGRQTWASRGYPDIDWARLGVRMQTHYGHVQRVLEGRTPSAFRAALQERTGRPTATGLKTTRPRAAKRGTTRAGVEDATKGGGGDDDVGTDTGDAAATTTTATTNAATVPGYYGQRGLRVMSEAIVRTFAPVLRRQAVQDPLIAARGYSQFVQDVLVPELAVRLIMEDMAVDAVDAQKILRDSVAIGELLHEEEDVVLDGEDDEDDEDDHWGSDPS
ncbi:hypothetical protein SPI_05009 [Niveomyces insectorum RCEF 264]|uniref:Restriction of telomere capping protein 4 n=1 Tax=Niveomyces insectorum RCEF 264 TaxID=1081102 RepID=A0A167TV92_9HYPO|nr:hypothetical protein SPI_05009 [Niveomyces insectorum RCEF 264]